MKKFGKAWAASSKHYHGLPSKIKDIKSEFARSAQKTAQKRLYPPYSAFNSIFYAEDAAHTAMGSMINDSLKQVKYYDDKKQIIKKDTFNINY
ncbi:hypothetical protein R9C00_14795 [Flammeovirgaceae bacterium SG7u.111]|nr:hypothetical protein [Flammeovirgaceae bacterium SG7u.132]WPO38727.1 hypothetical protein R9C00_14795 [Flammeovirgaceae bacterium SG7u.111]